MRIGNTCTFNKGRTHLSVRPYIAILFARSMGATQNRCVGITAAVSCLWMRFPRCGTFLRAFSHWADGNYSLPLFVETERNVGYEKNCSGLDATHEADAL